MKPTAALDELWHGRMRTVEWGGRGGEGRVKWTVSWLRVVDLSEIMSLGTAPVSNQLLFPYTFVAAVYVHLYLSILQWKYVNALTYPFVSLWNHREGNLSWGLTWCGEPYYVVWSRDVVVSPSFTTQDQQRYWWERRDLKWLSVCPSQKRMDKKRTLI